MLDGGTGWLGHREEGVGAWVCIATRSASDPDMSCKAWVICSKKNCRVSSSFVWGGEAVTLSPLGIMFFLLFSRFVGVFITGGGRVDRVSDGSFKIQSVQVFD